jgi:hypothetical protein
MAGRDVVGSIPERFWYRFGVYVAFFQAASPGFSTPRLTAPGDVQQFFIGKP